MLAPALSEGLTYFYCNDQDTSKRVLIILAVVLQLAAQGPARTASPGVGAGVFVGLGVTASGFPEPSPKRAGAPAEVIAKRLVPPAHTNNPNYQLPALVECPRRESPPCPQSSALPGKIGHGEHGPATSKARQPL
jgi:hypothetical protein